MEEIICKECNIKFNNLKQLTKHINDYHTFSVREYYDIYLKQDGEGICPICGNKTNFKSIRYGYYKTCSHKCHTCLQNRSYSDKEKDFINWFYSL